ncbi:M56 family metallopeptidase [Flavobacterium sp. JAS]|uniref:M56 family metallopeptidase n=1 Tax=Flavobacterium sp. JAS TaxID=2897329 RepID=UPI001E38E349|nr:M56 family metallopeptidase [Flavobacterium sp. JAS]MCD0468159.1 M56 family metallopeptidase [Flavobacterium sp. JAS]
MISYLLKSGILLLVFYAVYKLWLENEKMFRFNRAYLIGSLVFSLIIPLQLFSIELPFSAEISKIQLDGIVIRANKVVVDKIDYSEIIMYILGVVYVVIALVLVFRFVMNLFSFYQKMRNNKTQLIHDHKVVLIKEAILPHSFWNAIFINEEEFQNNKIPLELLTHEQAHLQQKHTLDILFIEILQIIFWFNPLIIFYKKAIKLNHEFLADEAVNKQFNSVSTYQNLLLDMVFNKSNVGLASTINYQITKKRFLMMTKEKSPVKSMLKVLSVGVISSLLLFVFSTKTSAQEVLNKIGDQEKTDYVTMAEIEVKPEFPGGVIEFYKYVGQNFKMPDEAAKNKIEGKAYMQFIVEKDGRLSKIKVLKDAGYGIGAEAVRVLKKSPKWTPGTIKGKPVRVMYSLPILVQAAS